MSGIHVKTFFVNESHVLAMTAGSYHDKTYKIIRCEAKLAAGASDMDCNRKEVSR